MNHPSFIKQSIIHSSESRYTGALVPVEIASGYHYAILDSVTGLYLGLNGDWVSLISHAYFFTSQNLYNSVISLLVQAEQFPIDSAVQNMVNTMILNRSNRDFNPRQFFTTAYAPFGFSDRMEMSRRFDKAFSGLSSRTHKIVKLSYEVATTKKDGE